MATGDGTAWDETTPTDDTLGINIDDHILDVRKGVRLRMANEHEWPSSMTGSDQAGMHSFITLQEQAAKPTLAGTQQAAIYVKTDLGLYFENSAGTEVLLSTGTGIGSATSDVIADTLTANAIVVGGDSMAKIDIDTYAGDGAATQAITGVGFQPKALWVFSQDGTQVAAVKTNEDGTKSKNISTNDYSDDIIVSLDADGFTVGDATSLNATRNLNKSGVTYTFIAWG